MRPRGPPVPSEQLAAIQEADPGRAALGLSEVKDFSQLLEYLGISENKLLQALPGIQKRVKALLYRYQDIFSNITPGCTDQVELNLELKPGTQPIRQRFQDMNPELEEKLQNQIQTWLDEGVSEPSKSPRMEGSGGQ